MRITRICRALVLLLAGVIAGASIASASDEALVRAKNLYASAAYDEALTELNRLQGAASAEDAVSIAEYRVFCLLALDRGDEARAGIERILRDNPRYLLPSDQTSPRIERIFRDVRRQSLPGIVAERYALAKAAFERKDSRAGQQFDDILSLLDDPDLDEVSALNDLRVVVSAFRDLTKTLAAPQTSVAATPAPQPAVSREPIPDPVYTKDSTDVTPPVVLSQALPRWRPPANLAGQEFRGVLRLLIDPSGAVVSAAMSTGTIPAYDQLLLRAARDWKFLPARKQGAPVRYLKLIEINLTSSTP